MDKKFDKAAVIKKVVDQEGRVKTIKNPDLLKVTEMEAGELYEGVTEDTPVSSEADYRMITRNDETVNTQGS